MATQVPRTTAAGYGPSSPSQPVVMSSYPASPPRTITRFVSKPVSAEPAFSAGYPRTICRGMVSPRFVSKPTSALPAVPEGRSRTMTHGVFNSSLVSKHTSVDSLRKHYEEIKELGQGSYGSVALVRELATGEKRVCKTVSTKGMAANILELMKKEIELLSFLDHPSVVKLYEYAEDKEKQKLLLILEYLPGGSCDTLVKDGKTPSEALVARLIHQLLTSLEYCHAEGIVHRDVKPENMMITETLSIWNKANCKLIDFGLADRKPKNDLLVGTLAYLAPEVIRFEQHTPKVDIWSVGVTTFELLSGMLPFGKQLPIEAGLGLKQPLLMRILDYKDFSELEKTFDNTTAPWWRSPSKESRDFLRFLLHPDPTKRPTASEALEHPWLLAHEPEPVPLSPDIMQSLAGFASAHPVVRCCLHIVAARACIPGIEKLAGQFLSADSDGDGALSREDLEGALEDVDAGWWWNASPTKVDIDGLLDAADFDHKGHIGYTGFIAACIYARQGSTEELMKRAFYAMDDDRDGFVKVADIKMFFRERDADLLASLPQNGPFNLTEWCTCVDAHIRKGNTPKHTHRRVRSHA